MKWILSIFLISLFFFTLFFGCGQTTLAASNNFVSIVNPIRGRDFFEGKQIVEPVIGQMEVLKRNSAAATWLVRFDALSIPEVINVLKTAPSNHEVGLFLEVTDSWTNQSGVKYHKTQSWHFPGSIFLTGYSQDDRNKLIDKAFESFRNTFGYYPKSVGAWWIDGYSLEYMQKKYGITNAMIVADQYSTDNYQIWGQYFSTPYYPDKDRVINPAQSEENKIPVVITQWAPRDPVNGYGKGVEESTYSVQANDYIDFHNLGINYFSKLVDLYTNQKFNQFGQLIVGLENSYDWDKYKGEYEKEVKLLVDKQKQGRLSIVTLSGFANFYKTNFPKLSPEHLIIAEDPLGTDKKAIWFMNPYYRAAFYINDDGNSFKDIRQYIEGDEELCLKEACESLNFATSATRVLDYVTFGHRWVIDEGKIKGLKVERSGEKYVVIYTNEANNKRTIEFLPRDISIDGKISSIDVAILNSTFNKPEEKKSGNQLIAIIDGSIFAGLLFGFIKFLLFITTAIKIPGYVITKKIVSEKLPQVTLWFISFGIGIVSLTLISYLSGLLGLDWFVYIYALTFLVLFWFCKDWVDFKISRLTRFELFVILLIFSGVIFQLLPVYKSGINYSFGVGFWGPNAHDGVWHLSLMNKLENFPPQNPILSGETLRNYHYFYDLLVNVTSKFSFTTTSDLLFRFYPVLISVLLGFGAFILSKRLFNSKLAVLLGIYLVYFSGSFGWIVEYIREKHFGGESAFWANQPISFNLNPPFAVSLILVILVFVLLDIFVKNKNWILAVVILLITGSLLQFKAYGAILVLGTLFIVGLIRLFAKRDFNILFISIAGGFVALGLLLPNYQSFNLFQTAGVFEFYPFWLVNSMLDFQDRVGWVRLAMARDAGYQSGNWFKFIAAEVIALIIFIGGNLGVRIFGIFGLFNVYKKDFLHLGLAIFSFLAILIPLLFVQRGTAWNTVQFMYYLLFFSALFTGGTLAWIYNKLPKALGSVILAILLIVAPINAVVTAKGYLYPSPHTYISQKELDVLDFLKNQEEGVVLTYPYDKGLKNKIAQPLPLLAYETTSYVSAYSNKSTFIEDEIQQDILQTEYKRRLIATKDFIQATNSLNDQSNGEKIIRFLKDNKIKYIYLPKVYNFYLPENKFGITKIFENEEVVLYLFN